MRLRSAIFLKPALYRKLKIVIAPRCWTRILRDVSRYLKINVTEVNTSWLGLNRIHIHSARDGYTCQFEHVKRFISFFFVGKRTGRHYSCDCGVSIPLYRCSVPGSSSRIPLIVLVPPRTTIDLGTIADYRDFSNFAHVTRDSRGGFVAHYMHLLSR